MLYKNHRKSQKITENKVEVMIKARVSPEIAKWLEKHKAFREKGNVTFRALEFYHDYLFYRKGFFIRMVEANFELIKHIVRVIGRSNKE